MKTITKLLLFVLWLTALFTLEGIYPGTSSILFIVGSFFLLSPMFCDYLEEHVGFPLLSVMGFSCFIIPVVGFFIGIRVIHEEDSSVRLVSSFYPLGRTLAVGESVDTLHKVPRCYRRLDEGGVVVHSEDLFLLKKNDTMSILFDKHIIIFEGRNISYFESDYGHGQITIFSYITPEGQHRVVDSDGRDVNDSGYHVRMIEPPPDPGYVPNY